MMIPGIVAGQQRAALPPDISRFEWRILISQSQDLGFGNIGLAELGFVDTTGALVDTEEATVEASDNIPGLEAFFAFDGDPFTQWMATRGDDEEPAPVWLAASFDSERLIHGLLVTGPEESIDAPRQFALQYKDGFSWVTVFVIGEQTHWSRNDTRQYDPNVRVWRIEVTETEHGEEVAIADLQFRTEAGEAEIHAENFSQATAGENPQEAFDHDPETGWTAPVPAALQYWFLSKRTVKQVFIRGLDGARTKAPKDFTIDYSDDFGVSWTNFMTVVDAPAWEDGESRTFGGAGYGFDYGNSYGI